MLSFAVNMALDAGRLLLEKQGRVLEINYKGDTNLVTEADLAAEHLIIEQIRSHYPRHAILAEESGGSEGFGYTSEKSEYKWIIDPLDGTTNYAHGYPCFSVSIGLEFRGEIILGVIYDPTRDEMFTAERGAGAAMNGRRIKVSATAELQHALVCTGFPYDVRTRPNFAHHFVNFILNSQGVRRDGSAAIDLAYVACGRFDGFWEEHLKPWDCAAGVVIIEEAGGKITRFDGSPLNLYSSQSVASNGLIHQQMLDVLIS